MRSIILPTDKYLLDTNIIIGLVNNDESIINFINSLTEIATALLNGLILVTRDKGMLFAHEVYDLKVKEI